MSSDYHSAKVHQRLLQLYKSAHSNNDISNLDIKKNIMDKLLSYQKLHVFNMITSVKNNLVSFDGSHPGTGKTYTTAAVCAQLHLVPFIICMRSNKKMWKTILKLFDVPYVAIVNYESIRSSKYIDDKGKSVLCPYIKKTENGFEWDFSSFSRPKDVVMIFDEGHVCKNQKSLNGKLLLSCKTRKTIFLSGSLCDKPQDFGIFGVMLGFYKTCGHGKSWMQSILREDKNRLERGPNALHKRLFPHKGSMMSKDELGDSFPMNQICIECRDLDRDSTIRINRCYDQILQKNKNRDAESLLVITELRQKIENYKTSIIMELVLNYHEQDRSIVIFVNYLSTHRILGELLNKHNIEFAEISGKQNEDERQKNIDSFQNNEVRVILCMIQAGGTSISLHDTTGKFPRVSIISPSYSHIELTQALGRICRAEGRSPCIQKIIFCSDTYEESIAKILESKKEMLDKITDEELDVIEMTKQKPEKPVDVIDDKSIIKKSIIVKPNIQHRKKAEKNMLIV